MSSARSDIYDLAKLAKELEQRLSSTGIPIPENLQTQIAELNQNVKAFLQASQEDSDSKERDNLQREMVYFIWIIFFNNIIYTIRQEHAKFDISHTCMIKKEHARDVIADDIREKIRLVHEMLKQWPHVVPPEIKNINLPAGHLQNDMLLASWDDGIEPCVGFVEPPSLKPDSIPLSIQDYIKSEYIDDSCYVGDYYCDFDWGFKEFANYLNDNSSFNRFQYDPTFLSEVMEKYGHLNGYLDVLRMFPYSLSHYHPDE